MFLKTNKGQSMLESALLIVVVVAGLLAMQKFVSRGYEGRLKGSGDNIGDQFSPGAVTYDWHTDRQSNSKDLFGVDNSGNAAVGTSETRLTTNIPGEGKAEVTKRWGKETITAGNNAYK